MISLTIMSRDARMSRIPIEVQHATKRFGAFTAVDDVSFVVKEGSIFSLLGPNGAGKTTMIKMLTTLLRPTAGKLFIDGIDVCEFPGKARKQFGVVFQDPSVDDELSASENMALHAAFFRLPVKAARARTEWLLKVFELWDRRDERLKRYSGGMRRRLEIARGFLHTPRIIFLDEPTAGLDSQTRRQMWAYIKKINQEEGITIFLTTHYLEEADQMATHVTIMNSGRLVCEGSPGDLKVLSRTHSLEDAFLAFTAR